jgi:hypothetical protein
MEGPEHEPWSAVSQSLAPGGCQQAIPYCLTFAEHATHQGGDGTRTNTCEVKR